MKFFSSESGIKTHVLAIEPGEYMLESITELIERAGIRDGAVVSGIGTLDQCIMHMVKPGGQVIVEWDDTPLELVGMQGVIADGVPHIHASNLDDALFAQGYVTASERLWQMDSLRRLSAGDLSEIVGVPGLQFDRESRRLRIRRIAEEIYPNLAPAERAASWRWRSAS